MSESIFYSWQSDLPAATNNTFIQEALEEAMRSVSRDGDLSVEPVVDRDVLGLPGSPEITRSLFEKIERAAVFVADVSIINREAGGRPTPNPNVLVELGYALHALGHARVLLVANAAFGEPALLPFDLRMRPVIAYRLPVDAASPAPERHSLARALSAALRAIFRADARSPVALKSTSGQRGKRIGAVLEMMNDAWCYERFTASSVAEALGIEYISEIEHFIDGNAEPPIPFLDRFCKEFGVSGEWLKHGRSAPFAPPERPASPLRALERIRELNPTRILFVRSEAPRGECGIVLKLSDLRFACIAGDWPISSHVGAGGAWNIQEFYQLIRELRESREHRHRLSGRLYPARDFARLFGGECHPVRVERPGSVASHWWDDFADTETPHFTPEQLEQMWGKEFTRAQDIVREHLRASQPPPRVQTEVLNLE